MRLFSEIKLDSELSRYGIHQKQKDSVRKLIYIIADLYSIEIEKRDSQIEKMKLCRNCEHCKQSKCWELELNDRRK